MSEGKIPGTDGHTAEVSPEKGINFSFFEEGDVKEGEYVYLVVKRPDKLGLGKQLFKVSRQNGYIALEPVKDDLGDDVRRKALAKAIVRAHKEEILDQAEGVVQSALERKPVKMLEEIKEQSDRGYKAKIKSRVGCIYLKIGRKETIL